MNHEWKAINVALHTFKLMYTFTTIQNWFSNFKSLKMRVELKSWSLGSQPLNILLQQHRIESLILRESIISLFLTYVCYIINLYTQKERWKSQHLCRTVYA